MDSHPSPSDAPRVRRALTSLDRSAVTPLPRVGLVLRSALSFGRRLGVGLGQREISRFPVSMDSVRVPDGAWHLPTPQEAPTGPVDTQMAALRAAMTKNRPAKQVERSTRGVPIVARRMGRTMKGESVGPSGLTRQMRSAELAIPRNESHGADRAAHHQVVPEDPMEALRRGMQARRDAGPRDAGTTGAATPPKSSTRPGAARPSPSRPDQARRSTDAGVSRQAQPSRPAPRARSGPRPPRSATDADGTSGARGPAADSTASSSTERTSSIPNVRPSSPAAAVAPSRVLRRRAASTLPMAGRRRAPAVEHPSGTVGIRPHQYPPAGVARRSLAYSVAIPMTGLGPRAADDNGPPRPVSVAAASVPALVTDRDVATSPQAVLADRSRPLAERVAALAARDGAPVTQGASTSRAATPPAGASTATGVPVLTRSAIYRSASSASAARLAPPVDPEATPSTARSVAHSSASGRALHRLVQLTTGRPRRSDPPRTVRGSEPVGRRPAEVRRAFAAPSSGSATPASSSVPSSTLRSLSDDEWVVPDAASGVLRSSPIMPAVARRVERSAAPTSVVAAGLASTWSAPEAAPVTPATSAPAVGSRAMVAQLASRVVSRRVDASVPQHTSPQHADRVVRRSAAVGSPLVGQIARTMMTSHTMASTRSASIQQRVASAVSDAQPTRLLARRVAADASASEVVSPVPSVGSSAVRSSTIGATVAPRSSTMSIDRRALPATTRTTTPTVTASRSSERDTPAMVTTASGQSVPAAVMDRSLSLAERVAALAGGGTSTPTRSVGASASAGSAASVSRSAVSPQGVTGASAHREAAAPAIDAVSVPSPVWSLPVAGRAIVARRVERSEAGSTGPVAIQKESLATKGPGSSPEMSVRRQRSTRPVTRTVRDVPARRVTVQPPTSVMRMMAADSGTGMVVTGDREQAQREQRSRQQLCTSSSGAAMPDFCRLPGFGVQFKVGAPPAPEHLLTSGTVSSGNEAGTALGVASSMVIGPDHSIMGSAKVFSSAMRQRASRSVMRSADARTTVMRSADTTSASASPAAVRPAPSAVTGGRSDDIPAAVRDRSLPLAERVAALAGRGAGAAPAATPLTSPVAHATLPVRPAVAAVAGGHAGGVDRSMAPRPATSRGATTSSTRLIRTGGSDRVVPAPLPAPRTPMVTPSSAPSVSAVAASSGVSTSPSTSSSMAARPTRRQPSASLSRQAASVARQAHHSPVVADESSGAAPTPARRTMRSQTAIQRRAMRASAPTRSVVSREAAPPPAPSRSSSHHTDQIEMTEQLLEALEERILRALERRGGVQRGWF